VGEWDAAAAGYPSPLAITVQQWEEPEINDHMYRRGCAPLLINDEHQIGQVRTKRDSEEYGSKGRSCDDAGQLDDREGGMRPYVSLPLVD
jgi:hypothetical protein